MNYKQLIVLLLAVLSSSISLVAQKHDTDSVEGYRFIYEFTYPGRNKQMADRQVLDVTASGTSFFYSQYEVEKRKAADEVSKSASNTADALTALTRINTLPRGNEWTVYKNVPKSGDLTYIEPFLKNQFKYTVPLPAIEWSVSTEQKEVCGYVCQKVEGELLGRHWTVWYTSDIPLSEGPWKLWGLPGIIFEATDVDSLFHFTCVGIESVRLAPIVVPKKKYLKCTHDELENERRKKDADRIAYLKKAMGQDFVVRDANGKVMKSMPVDATYLERREGDKR